MGPLVIKFLFLFSRKIKSVFSCEITYIPLGLELSSPLLRVSSSIFSYHHSLPSKGILWNKARGPCYSPGHSLHLPKKGIGPWSMPWSAHGICYHFLFSSLFLLITKRQFFKAIRATNPLIHVLPYKLRYNDPSSESPCCIYPHLIDLLTPSYSTV